MTLWIFSDPHLSNRDHKHFNRMLEWSQRPGNYNELIIKRLRCVRESDTLYSLGDMAFGNEKYWNTFYNQNIKGRSILTLGNHDKRSYNFYYNCGYDYVCQNTSIIYRKKHILFSHRPQDLRNTNYDFNIHGHFHNNSIEHCLNKESNLKEFYDEDKHIKISPEELNYMPLNLDVILNEKGVN